MTTDIIEARELTKYFVVERPLHRMLLSPLGAHKKICALDKVSFGMKSGEILGVVGANGAGKTTLLRILADLLSPDSGQVRFCGCALDKDSGQLRSKTGYVSSDERSFFWRLSGKQNLDFFTRLYGISGSQARQRITEMVSRFGLSEKANQLFRDYSSGTRKKFSLIRALNHQPYILLLDEITNSLDPSSTQAAKTMVRDYISTRENCAAVWSTHRLEEIAEICDKILMLDSGCACFYGTVANFLDSPPHLQDYLSRVRDMNESCKAFHSCFSNIK